MLVEILNTIYSSPTGFTVLNVKYLSHPTSTFKATAILPCPVSKGQVVDIDGQWEVTKHGRQFKITNMQTPEPVGKEAIKKYLSSAVKGIGPAFAERIVEKFGDDTLRMLDTNPEILLDFTGIGSGKVKTIAQSWYEQRTDAKNIMTLCSLGLSVNYAAKAYKHFGVNSLSLINANPYILTQIHGIGFLKADEIAANCGFTGVNTFRIESAALYCIENAMHIGHCCLPIGDLLTEICKIIGIKDEKAVKEALDNLVSARKLVFLNGSYYDPSVYESEVTVWQTLQQLAYRKRVIDEKKLQAALEACAFLNDKQLLACRRAMQNHLSVITGGPGTGKTLSTRALVHLLEIFNVSYSLCSQTGKAAKRLSEATGREATTIHRLLENQGGRFSRNKSNPLTVDFVIVDETSMVDINLMAALLSAMSNNTAVVLIGDADQLPSIGPGSVFRDLIASELCHVTRLDTVYRQSDGSEIIRLAHWINSGSVPAFISSKDVVFQQEDHPEKIMDAIRIMVGKLPFAKEEIQILSPMNKTLIGVKQLNRVMQSLNSQPVNYGGFKVDDRVIQLVNNYQKGVFNGEIGYVKIADSENKTLTVDFSDKVISYDQSDLDELSLAYCISIHRAQGSEFPCVIVPVHTQHYVLLSRELLYTAVTRAKKMLIVIGMSKAISIACNNDRNIKRFTGYRNLLCS